MIGVHDYLNITGMLCDIFDEFHISSKVIATTTDNASNFAKAFR